MVRAAVLLASASLVTAPLAATSDAATLRSVTIRVYVEEVTRSVKDVPPKTFTAGHVYTKGDTIRGTESLENAVPQFNKPKGARVGTDRYVITAVAWEKIRADFITTFPGGTVHAHGEGMAGAKPEVPIVGGTHSYAGATGSIEGQHLANGKKLNVYRIQIP